MTIENRNKIGAAWKRAVVVRDTLDKCSGKRITQDIIEMQDGLVDQLAQILTDTNPKNQVAPSGS